mgnify:CR=1 FL=1|tara:strand:- start:409 stop:618 length:210 start_codon:yes stop_codon:yes gene_type:complete
MNTIEGKLNWLNIHCNNMFFISTNEEGNRFNIRVRHGYGNKELERTNLSRYLLHKELDNLEDLLSKGYI